MADPGFPRWEAELLFGQIFFRKLHENESVKRLIEFSLHCKKPAVIQSISVLFWVKGVFTSNLSKNSVNSVNFS